MTADPLLTVPEAADRLKCSASHVRNTIRRGKLTAIVDGAFIRIRQFEVERYITEHTTAPVRRMRKAS